MGEIRFADNYNDLSEETGVRAGFQFEFFCERCGDTWRSCFVSYRAGQASGWLSRAAGVIGGMMGSTAANAVEGLAQSGYGKAHDEAFQTAIEEAKGHFYRCARCYQYVCEKCRNRDTGLCLNCAPDAEVEIEAAKAQGEVYGAGEKAALEGTRRGKQKDVKSTRQLVCPNCGTETKGAKFCPQCGFKLAVKDSCPACSSAVSPGAKFCPECGQKL